MRKRIGEWFVRAGVMSEHDVRVALAEQRRTGERFGSVLVRLHLTTERQLARALAYQLELPYTNFVNDPPDPDAIALIPRDFASKRLSIGTRVDDDGFRVAMADPLLFGLVKDLEARTGRHIRPVVATRTDILRAIQAGYSGHPRPASMSAEGESIICGSCRRRLESGWRYCPFCAARVVTRLARTQALPDAASM